MIKKLLKDCLTGLDGQSYAIGKVLSIPTLVAGLAVPFGMIAAGQTVNLAELGVFEGAMIAGTTGLIRLTHAVEPTSDNVAV